MVKSPKLMLNLPLAWLMLKTDGKMENLVPDTKTYTPFNDISHAHTLLITVTH